MWLFWSVCNAGIDKKNAFISLFGQNESDLIVFQTMRLTLWFSEPLMHGFYRRMDAPVCASTFVLSALPLKVGVSGSFFSNTLYMSCSL